MLLSKVKLITLGHAFVNSSENWSPKLCNWGKKTKVVKEMGSSVFIFSYKMRDLKRSLNSHWLSIVGS